MEAHPFGEPEPGEAVKPTFFNPTAGYTPHGDKQFVRRAGDGKWVRVDQIQKEQPVTQALAERQPTTVTWPKQQIDLVRRTVAVGATDDELALYLYDCDRRGIHPLDKLLHFTKRGGKYTPVTSIDFMRAQAAMSGEMAGSDDPIYIETDGKLVSATVIVYRMTQGQRFPYTATARWSEYCPDNAQMWRKMPHTMLAKCAEALALRKAFPQQLAGLYSSEEMDQSGGASGPAVAPPARSEAREKPVAATVENRGASIKTERVLIAGNEHAKDGDPVYADVAIEQDTLPEGYRLIDDYKLDGDWHHVTWGRDAQGGWMTYKTKLAKIGLQAHNAFTERHPVRIVSNKFPFLDRVDVLAITREQIAASKFNPDDDRFCDECGRPAKVCIC